MKICSFLPGGTEMVCALGLKDALVGVSHECDYPPEVKTKPVVVRSAVDSSRMSSAELDRFVSEKLRKGESLYEVDQQKLKDLNPDLVITQELCRVCAPAAPEAQKALATVRNGTRVLYLTPRSLEDIFENIRSVGEAVDRLEEAKQLVYDLRLHAVTVQVKTFRQRKPRVFILEWLDPPFNAGHWIPEMVEISGGIPEASSLGKDSRRVSWEEIAEFNPDVLICAPCGHHLEGALREAELLKKCPFPDRINAFRDGRVYAVDADAYLVRPGPRIVSGIELLAHILHPESCGWNGPKGAFHRISKA